MFQGSELRGKYCTGRWKEIADLKKSKSHVGVIAPFYLLHPDYAFISFYMKSFIFRSKYTHVTILLTNALFY